jgi:transcriptional regulator with XRE-family HTH domain
MLHMPTGRQIRAARMLLDWDAIDLAEHVGMSRVSIQNIERGEAQPKAETIEKIVRAFADVGIEFIENEGLRRRQNGVEIFEGQDRFNKFYDFLYDHLKQHGGDVCLSVVDEHLLAQYRKDPDIHRKRMKELVARGDVTFRVLATESDFVSAYAQYKWQPRQSAAPTSFYAFGDCLALISFVHTTPPYVVVIQSAPLAEAYRQAFETAWTNAKPPQQINDGKP